MLSFVPKFLEIATPSVVKEYLRLYGVSQDNETVLLKTGNLNYLEVYFERYTLSLKGVEYMFELNNPEIVGEYIRYHELPPFTEFSIFATFNASFRSIAPVYIAFPNIAP